MSSFLDQLSVMPPEKRRYALQTLPTHLAEAGQSERLRRVLITLDFLQVKVDEIGVQPLIEDYEPARHDEGLALIQGALRLGAHVVEQDHTQLYSQLSGRLSACDAPAVLDLLASPPGRSWLRPLTPSLTPTGGAMLRTFFGHTYKVSAVVALPDGERIVSASEDGSLMVWNVETGRLLRELAGHNVDAEGKKREAITSLALLPDGRRVVSGSREGTLRVWDVNKGAELHTLGEKGKEIVALAALPDGRRVVSSSQGGTLRMWDVDAGTELRALHEQAKRPYALAALPDGRRVVYGSGGTLMIWDVETGEAQAISRVMLAGADEDVLALAVFPHGRKIVAGSRSGKVTVWNVDTRREEHTLHVSKDAAIRSIALLPGARRVLTGTWNGALELWDLELKTRLHTIARNAGPHLTIAALPDGRRAVVGNETGKLSLWDLESGGDTGISVVSHQHDGPVYFVAVLPDGRRAMSVGDDAKLMVWDLKSRKELLTFVLYDRIDFRGRCQATALADNRALVGLPNGSLVAMELAREGAISTWAGHALNVTALAALAGGKRIISASQRGDVKVWDANFTERLAFSVRDWGDSPAHFVEKMVVLPDGRHVLSASVNGALRIWDVETGALAQKPPKPVRLGALLPGGKGLLGWVRAAWHVWDLETWSEQYTIASRQERPSEVFVVPDGRHAISLLDSGILQMWSLEHGTTVAGFGADARLISVGAVPDGSMLVAGDEGGCLHFLQLERAGSASGRTWQEKRTQKKWWRFWRR